MSLALRPSEWTMLHFPTTTCSFHCCLASCKEPTFLSHPEETSLRTNSLNSCPSRPQTNCPHGRAGQGRAGQGRQGRAQQGRAGAGQGRAGQGRAGQGRAGQKEINLTVWHEDVALWDILMALRGHSRLKTCPELTVFVIHECGELPQSGKGVRLTWCGLPVQTVLRATSACSCSTSPSDRSGSLRCSEAWIDR